MSNLGSGGIIYPVGGTAGGLINPMTTAGDIIYGTTAGAPVRLGIGSPGQALEVSAGSLPSWVTPVPKIIQPSGDSSGSTDTSAIQTALNAGGTVQLASGKYYLNAPLNIPPYTALAGAFNTSQVTQTDGGTTLIIVSGFTGQTISDPGPITLSAAIVLLGASFGGYATVSEEQKVYYIQIDGTSAPAGVSGILSYGRVSRVHLNNVLVSKVTGDGVQQNQDSAGNQPDAWGGYKVFCRFGSGKGFNLRSADSTWLWCLGSNNLDPSCDWFINTTSNSKYLGIRSEHAAGSGIGYVCTNSSSASGGVTFSALTTDQSALHGMQLGGTINSVVSFAHATPILISGSEFRRDGSASTTGSYAGIQIMGYGSSSGGLVTLDGVQTWPGVNDPGSGINTPQYGISINQNSNVNITGSAFLSASTAIFDDGTNSINYDNSVVTGTGSTTSTLAINMSPNIAAYQGKSLTLTPGASPGTDPLFIQSAGTGQRAMGIRVPTTGSNDFWKITSSGVQSWGPGSSTQDVNLYRVRTGTLGTDNNFYVGGSLINAAGAPVGIQPSGDTSGATDTASIQALLNGTLPTFLAPGSFYIGTSGVVSTGLTVPAGGFLQGSGWGQTTLYYIGSGTAISSHGNAPGGSFTQGNGTTLLYFTVDGSSVPTNVVSTGISVGDMYDILVDGVSVNNFTGTATTNSTGSNHLGAVGFDVANLNTLTEKCYARVTVNNCTNGFQFYTAPAAVNTSRMYSEFDYHGNMQPNQNMLVIARQGHLMNGRFIMRGNMNNPNPSTANTSAAIVLGTGNQAGHIQRMELDVHVESDPGTSATLQTPTTVLYGSNSDNQILGCRGRMQFLDGFQTASPSPGAFQFSGRVVGDTTLSTATAVQFGPANNPTVESPPSGPASGTVYTNAGIDSMVYMTGGTVSSVLVNGTTTGTTSGAFMVPMANTVQVNFTGAPTWTWIGVLPS